MNNLLKNDIINRGSLGARFRRAFQVTLAMAALALVVAGHRGQTQSLPTTTNKTGISMKQFVFLFRQSARQLSEADQKRRAEEVRAWALRQNQEGRKLDPRILGAENHLISPDSKGSPVMQSGDGSLLAITFLEASDFTEAVTIAETHPGLHYGVSVEVREWTPPPAPPTGSK
jgi:hypothetical protein